VIGNKGQGVLCALVLVPFVILSTLNSASYRYGASDQAFYVPAILSRLDPQLFPRDGPLIVSQARLTFADDVIGALARTTGSSLPVLLATLYVLSLVLLAAAAWLIASRFYRTTWATVALLAALTLRHQISRSGTNTLEGYFHPRQLAFGFGALAIAALLRKRLVLSVVCVGLAGVFHPTTALWFAIWVGVAVAVVERPLRVPLAAAAIATVAAVLWALTAGPLAGRLARMDPEWLATLVTKDYLFPLDWPITVWAVNLLYIPVIVLVYRRRAAGGLVDRDETGVVAGCLSLLLVFTVALPLNGARIAIAVQLQIPRVFWMLDFLAIIYMVWALAEAGLAAPKPDMSAVARGAEAGSAKAEGRRQVNVRRAQLTAAIVTLASLARGTYVKLVGHSDRPVAQVHIRDDDWGRAMAWARTTPPDSGWLADPMHAIRYGTSLRVAGQRDVLVEAVKDAAIGMYDRAVAMRTRDHLAAVGDFAALTTGRVRALGLAYGLDYLITDQTLDLPIAFQSGSLRVYRLR
jgi:hypothetical protein